MNAKQIVYLSQSQYAELIANGTITVNGVTVTYDENDIYVTPQVEPVTDVRVNGASITANGVANIPVASSSGFGVAKIGSYQGVDLNANGELQLQTAADYHVKSGVTGKAAIVPLHQHEATFYGLAKAAGADMKDIALTTVGTYPDAQKSAIQQMLGISTLIGPAENNLVASKAYAIGDVFTANGKLYKATAAIAADAAIIPAVEGEEIAGANCEETSVGEGFVKFTDYANANSAGVVVIGNAGGLYINPNNGVLRVSAAASNEIRYGTQGFNYKPITPAMQRQSTFYGLAQAAGMDTTQDTLPIGQYTDAEKASIKAMLGIQDGSTGTVDVTGTTPTITAVENTRYVCDEVTSLSFTPPASGISIVRFTSGSTVTLLTIPSTVKFPEWFDPTSLETNTIYEICVTDGIYGAVMSWAL